MIASGIHPLTILRFETLAEHKEIRHLVSTRVGGVSPPPFDSLNLGFNTDDHPGNVLANRERLAGAVGIPLDRFVTLKQVHGSRVEVVTSDMAGRGASDYKTAMDGTDATVTDVEDLCLVVRVADCAPVLLYDPVRRVVGAVHAGWRGTVEFIGRKTVAVMKDRFGCRAEDILAGVGPSIGPCCYQVGPEVISQVESAFEDVTGLIERRSSDGKGYLNLWEANRRQLNMAGLRAENIEVAGICTRCRADIFFSERHRQGTGRFAAGIMLVNEICASCTAIHCSGCNR